MEAKRKPIFYNSVEEFDKPVSELIENIRSELARVRGKLSDIRCEHGFEDKIKHLEGGLTCIISSAANTVKDFKRWEEVNKLEIERYDPEDYTEILDKEGWQHFLKGNIITSEFSEDVIYSIRTEKLTREEIMERYNIKFR